MSSHPEGSASLGPRSRDPKSFSRPRRCRMPVRGPRGMAQLGSASALGAEGRRFESGYPDRQARSAARGATCCASGIAGRGCPQGAAERSRRGQSWRMPHHLADGPRGQRAAVGARLARTTRGWRTAATCVRRGEPRRRPLRGHRGSVDHGRPAHRGHRQRPARRRGAVVAGALGDRSGSSARRRDGAARRGADRLHQRDGRRGAADEQPATRRRRRHGARRRDIGPTRGSVCGGARPSGRRSERRSGPAPTGRPR